MDAITTKELLELERHIFKVTSVRLSCHHDHEITHFPAKCFVENGICVQKLTARFQIPFHEKMEASKPVDFLKIERHIQSSLQSPK